MIKTSNGSSWTASGVGNPFGHIFKVFLNLSGLGVLRISTVILLNFRDNIQIQKVAEHSRIPRYL
jgi:hypothetical protein